MLILTPKLGESIKTGDDVTITVLGINNGQIRIGVDTPKVVPVHGTEIYHRTNQQPRKTLEYEIPAEQFNACVATTG